MTTTASLTPALALAYLCEMSVDVRAAVVLDARGEPVAGDERIATSAHRLLRAAEREEPAAEGMLLVAGAPGGPAIAVVAGPCALLPLLRHDLAGVREALATGASSLA